MTTFLNVTSFSCKNVNSRLSALTKYRRYNFMNEIPIQYTIITSVILNIFIIHTVIILTS